MMWVSQIPIVGGGCQTGKLAMFGLGKTSVCVIDDRAPKWSTGWGRAWYEAKCEIIGGKLMPRYFAWIYTSWQKRPGHTGCDYPPDSEIMG